MPRKGPAYPTSPEWKAQVREAIGDLIESQENEKVTSEATFAKFARISKSALSEALAPDRQQTPMMPDINAALGWPAPRVLSTPDELELWAAVEALSDRDLGRMIGMAEATLAKLRRRRG